MNNFKAIVNGSDLRIYQNQAYAPTRDLLSVTFQFSKEWEEFEDKIIVFKNRKTKEYYESVLHGNVLTRQEFPDEIAWHGGSYNVCIYGEHYNEDKTKLISGITTGISFMVIVPNEHLRKELEEEGVLNNAN